MPGRLVFGYSGWSAGQLEREMEEGAWLALPYAEDLAFSASIDDLWQRCSSGSASTRRCSPAAPAARTDGDDAFSHELPVLVDDVPAFLMGCGRNLLVKRAEDDAGRRRGQKLGPGSWFEFTGKKKHVTTCDAGAD